MIAKRKFWIASAALVAFALSPGRVSARMHPTGDDDARSTLREIEALASHVEEEADQLVHVSQDPNLSPYSHLVRLDAMKDELNEMGRDIATLEAERGTLPLWEQRAVEDTLPLLRDAATNTDNAIHYFNENRTHLWTPAYRGYATNIYDDSSRIAKSLRDDFRGR